VALRQCIGGDEQSLVQGGTHPPAHAMDDSGRKLATLDGSFKSINQARRESIEKESAYDELIKNRLRRLVQVISKPQKNKFSNPALFQII
jgi:hypothetical protein